MSRAVVDALRTRLGASVIDHHALAGDDTVILAGERIVEACRFLRDDEPLAMKVLMDLTAVDYLGRAKRFDIVYHLYSPSLGHRVRLKAPLDDVEEGHPEIDSVASLWASANWYEREVWDLYGIRFRGHPDLRRVLLYEEFIGHPLRKDYPKDRRQPLVRRSPMQRSDGDS